MPGSISFNCETGRMMFAPFTVCCFINPNSSGVSEPGFFNTRSSTPIFPTSCSNAAMRNLSSSSVVRPSSWPISVEYFATADRARGGRQPADGSANAHREKITDENGGQNDHADERQRLPVQFGDAGVTLRLIEAPLRNDRPIHFRKSAVRSDHLDRVFLVRFGKTHRFRVAELLRQRLHFCHK